MPTHVCGPEWIQTLRGQLLGREVALICCGEAHEDAIDLTRSGCIVEPEEDWLELSPDPGGPGFDPGEALAVRDGLTLEGAKSWAERIVSASGDDMWGDEAGGAILIFEVQGTNMRGTSTRAKGSARVLPPGLERSTKHPLPLGAIFFEWGDIDAQARSFNARRLQGEDVPVEEYDALIAQRKVALAADGVELFDDWLLRQASASLSASAARGSGARIEFVVEAPVPPWEVELHEEPDVGPALPAHECLRRIELDSDEDSDEEGDPNDGTAVFLDYLKRQASAKLPRERIHCIDPRGLGECEDVASADAWQALLSRPLPEDTELLELERAGAVWADERPSDEEGDEDGGEEEESDVEEEDDLPSPLPSWEAYFGAASELLYYSGHVKADYTPLLATCFRDVPRTQRFFEALFFATVPEALSELHLDAATRPLTRLRSHAYLPDGETTPLRRPDDWGVIPVAAAPLDMYLKARGSLPPRTWVSGIAQRLRDAGASAIVDAAREWYRGAVEKFLQDTKGADTEGDYFAAYLRECHRKIYDDIDHSTPEELRDAFWVPSRAAPRDRARRHRLGDIRIPDGAAAFCELAAFDAATGQPATRRQRVLAKILVDIFQLRLVDLAAILRVADAVVAAPEGQRVVVILYAGADHASSVVEFWRARGFSHWGLPAGGMVGKERWSEGETRALELPGYLRQVDELFPVPRPDEDVDV